MVYAFRGRRYARPAYRRRAPYRAYRGAYRRAPARRGLYVAKRAFTRPPKAYSRGTGRFLKTKCSALRKRLVPYKEVRESDDWSRIQRTPKAGWVYIAPLVGPQDGHGRYIRKTAYSAMIRFLRGAGITSSGNYVIRGAEPGRTLAAAAIDTAMVGGIALSANSGTVAMQAN